VIFTHADQAGNSSETFIIFHPLSPGDIEIISISDIVYSFDFGNLPPKIFRQKHGNSP